MTRKCGVCKDADSVICDEAFIDEIGQTVTSYYCRQCYTDQIEVGIKIFVGTLLFCVVLYFSDQWYDQDG
jgi:hypothetical protein